MKQGKISQAALDRSVLRILSRANVLGEDAAVGADSAFRQIHVSADPAKPGDAAEAGVVSACSAGAVGGALDRSPAMLLYAALDNVILSGGHPFGVMVTVTVPADAEEKALADTMKAVAEAAKARSVKVLGGDTTVTDGAARVLVSVTALGWRDVQRAEISSKKTPVQASAAASGNAAAKIPETGAHSVERLSIVMAGYAGSAGASILEKAYHEKLSARLSEDYLAGIRPEEDTFLPADWYGSAAVSVAAGIAGMLGDTLMHDVSVGGVFGALWEFGEKAGAGFDVDLKAIPIRQETIEVCEILNANPYQLYGQGAILIASADPEKLIGLLQETGIPAAVIGRFHTDKARIIRNLDETRYLDKPQADMLWNLPDEV